MNRLLSLHFAARGWVLAALFAALAWSRALASPHEARLRWEMLALVAAGMLLRAWAGAHLGIHGNGSRAEAPALVTTGPYAFSRNPLYLSNLAVGTGLIFFANALSPEMAVAFLGVLLLHHAALARWEEKHLRRLWPEAYAAYAAATPRWFGLRPPAGAENITDTRDWAPVFLRQGRNLAYAAACVLIVWAAARI
jgi:protein-S-isoprenylcysteine O-methyltransferase Ste14